MAANTIRIYRSKQSEALDARFNGSPEELRVIYQTALDLYEQYESQSLSDMVNCRASRGTMGQPPSSAPSAGRRVATQC